MILLPIGTKVWYLQLDGTRIETEVQAHRTYNGDEKMEVYLPGDPGPALVDSNRLELRE